MLSWCCNRGVQAVENSALNTQHSILLCFVDHLAIDQGATDPALELEPDKGRVLALAFERLGGDPPMARGIEDADVRGVSWRQVAGVDVEHACRPEVILASATAGAVFDSSAHLSVSGSSSSSPVAPASASANGSCFASSSTGVWSEHSASTVPSASAARSASRSRWLRSGGSRRLLDSK